MARRGHKFPLVVYQHLVGRWWTPMFAMGVVMFLLAYNEYTNPINRFISWRWQALGGIGLLAFLTGIFFLVIRQLAYVQPMPGYIRFVTPFLRMNISYKRIHRTTVNEMRQLFPPKSMSGWVRDIFKPLAHQSAVVIELKAFPIPPAILRLFLSRFFFKDRTPHLVILVRDWMGFSTEIESFRSSSGPVQNPSQKQHRDSILSRLPRK